MKYASALSLAMTLCWLPLSATATPVQTDGAVIELRNTDIREFIEMVGNATGKTIIIDPRVKGVVDIRSRTPLSGDALYAVFLAQLKVNGFAVVDAGDDLLKVVPEQLARQEALPLQQSDQSYNRDQMVTRIIEVEHVEVEQLVPVLRPLVDARAGVVVPYAPSNVIMITDRAANIARIESMIDRIDQAGEDQLEVIRLSHGNAREIVKILGLLIKQGQPGGQGNLKNVSLVADERSNAVLLRGPVEARVYLRNIIYELDGNQKQEEAGSRIYYLKYAKAGELVEMSQKLVEAYLRRTTGNENAAQEVVIQAHEGTNAILASGSPDVLRELEHILAQVDIRRAQVLVEAIVVDISENRAKELGVQWLAYDRNGTTPVAGTNFSRNALPGSSNTTPGIFNLATAAVADDSSALAGQLAGSQGLLGGIGRISAGGISFAAMINALQAEGDANILSTPSLLTLDNQPASILVGQEVPVVTGTQLSDGNSNPFQTIKRQEIGVKLKVTPQVNEGNSIRLSIFQEVSSLSRNTAAADVITDKRSIDSTVMVDDGDTIVLGGLISDEITESVSKVPLLGDMPVLGALFRSSGASKQKRNLMVFIRPKIIRDADTLMGVTHRKYSYIRAEQLMRSDRGVDMLPQQNTPVLPDWSKMNLRPGNTAPTLDRYRQELR